MEGYVIKATGSWYMVRTVDGNQVQSRLPGKFRLSSEEAIHPVVVGDRVELKLQSDNTAIIVRIGERKTQLMRKATHGRRGIQLMAANVDRILIVQSIRRPRVKTGFIDRVLVYSESAGIEPVIVINKIDLKKGQEDEEKLKALTHLYSSLGYPLVCTSIKQKETLEQLGNIVKGCISVLSGPSGTGKTSLINALYPSVKLKTGEVSNYSQKGRHTTTYAELIELQDQTFLIDSPGIREFGLAGINPADVSHFFPEMKQPALACRYYNCSHRHEPDCSVLKAVRNLEISQSRYRSYLNMVESIENDPDLVT